jgi:hypothetical protein
VAAFAEFHFFRIVGLAAEIAAIYLGTDDTEDGAIARRVGAFDRLLIAHGLF